MSGAAVQGMTFPRTLASAHWYRPDTSEICALLAAGSNRPVIDSATICETFRATHGLIKSSEPRRVAAGRLPGHWYRLHVPYQLHRHYIADYTILKSVPISTAPFGRTAHSIQRTPNGNILQFSLHSQPPAPVAQGEACPPQAGPRSPAAFLQAHPAQPDSSIRHLCRRLTILPRVRRSVIHAAGKIPQHRLPSAHARRKHPQ